MYLCFDTTAHVTSTFYKRPSRKFFIIVYQIVRRRIPTEILRRYASLSLSEHPSVPKPRFLLSQTSILYSISSYVLYFNTTRSTIGLLVVITNTLVHV